MSGELDPEAYVWLSALTDELTEAQAKRLVDEVGVLGDEKEQELADSVLFVAARENLDVFKRLKEVSDMRFIRLLYSATEGNGHRAVPFSFFHPRLRML